ncbi:MAG: Crp/Fnr family transcriptional regulator [Bacteroidales bacterium]|nr:Crp/Fnr family transcriptional regulator [Bacteroidales bacterium]
MDTNCQNPERHCIGCEFKSPLFYFLTTDELNLVEKNKITVHFKKGETIRKQGTYMSHVISVNSGLAKLYLEGIEQRNAIIRIVKPTNFIGGPGIYLDQRHHFTITALMDTTICFIDVAVFTDIIDKNKIFAHEFMKDFSKNILSVYNRLLILTQKQMPGRMADTLLYLFDEIFESNSFSMHLSRQDISELSGMSKDSAIKILREFQHDGIIHLTENQMKLLDPEKLNMISKTG